MKIKSTVLQVLAAASLGAGLLYAMGIEGGAQLGCTITDGEFTTAMVLILAALALIQTERFSAHFPKIFVHRTMDLTGAIA